MFVLTRAEAKALRSQSATSKAFVKLREPLSSHHDLARKLEDLERKYDAQFRVVFDAIRDLLREPITSGRRIGFNRGEK